MSVSASRRNVCVVATAGSAAATSAAGFGSSTNETLDGPPLRFELVREGRHRWRADLHRDENLVAISEKALGLEVARMPKDRHDDREVLRFLVAGFDCLPSAPRAQVLKVERDQEDREREREIRRHLGGRLNDPLRDVLPCRTGFVRLALHDSCFCVPARQEVDPMMSLPHRCEDQRHDGDEGETACSGTLHCGGSSCSVGGIHSAGESGGVPKPNASMIGVPNDGADSYCEGHRPSEVTEAGERSRWWKWRWSGRCDFHRDCQLRVMVRGPSAARLHRVKSPERQGDRFAPPSPKARSRCRSPLPRSVFPGWGSL
jgi:hypothetical protein